MIDQDNLNKTATLADMTIIVEQIRVLEHKLDQLFKVLESKHQREKIFGDWITENQAVELTNLSKSTFLILRKEGKLTSSSISGKANFYRLSQIKELLEENEKNR
ncbi:MAG: hypothetical protein COA31_007090 [Flavobacteriales bacterium]|nr:hypothetical protein [Flavobacteriales bacterium]